MKLYSITPVAEGLEAPIVARIVTDDSRPLDCRRDSVLLWRESIQPKDVAGYPAVLTPLRGPAWDLGGVPLIHSIQSLDYLSDGDVVAVDPSGLVRTLYRKNSLHNSVLLTEQCNSYCLMCSQPPKPENDFDRLAEHFRLIDLIDPGTKELGLTGGEPTLFKDDFLRLIGHCKSRLPGTALHVLTNGRLFYYRELARRLGEIAHPDIMLGIPLYSDVDSEHDYVVQARGAFEETVLGMHNLARYGVPVEIRVVIHRQTYRRLPKLAEYIARNLPFAAHVALMGMEMFGFVHRNLGELWIDPYDYQPELRDATELLAAGGQNVSIYNHQLCVLDHRLWPYAHKSISDWKNIYLDVCTSCAMRDGCGGFFQSAAKKHSAHLRPIAQRESLRAAANGEALGA
jgi:His-Xaa-Ser system radical SAM maturase HxsC